jgi:uncharacterized protein (DUF885 family)
VTEFFWNQTMTKWILFALAAFSLFIPIHARADSIEELARDFWTWRAAEQPFTSDDVVRIERPKGWLPDWSPDAVENYRRQLGAFENRWKNLRDKNAPIPRQVDYHLIGSALARVRWELDLTRNWQRHPGFYVDQTLGAYVHLILDSSPFDAGRTRTLVATLKSIPATLENGKKNLTRPVAPFALLAIDQLEHAGTGLAKSVQELKPRLDPSASQDIDQAVQNASRALQSYHDWLKQRLPTMSSETAVGRDSYLFFLKNVAFLTYTPEQLLAMGRQEWGRAVSSQDYEEHRNQEVAPQPLFKDLDEQIRREKEQEQSVRQYLEQKDLLTVPAWVQRYEFVPMPAYLAAVNGISEMDDFTSASRLRENCSRYVVPPAPDLGYFALTMAKDPRGEIVHEGIPGHYLQLALSWAHPDVIRRHYYDSSANEGIGFYAEEMMLHAGLFDDSPKSREIIWNFMRLRALRVEVDVRLALGEFNIEQGADYLSRTVPMDKTTAHAEASFFAANPGQAISYQIGKIQIYDFLASAQRQKGKAFSLRAFHDFLWLNGNVPIALQRWEYLGESDAPHLE